MYAHYLFFISSDDVAQLSGLPTTCNPVNGLIMIHYRAAVALMKLDRRGHSAWRNGTQSGVCVCVWTVRACDDMTWEGGWRLAGGRRRAERDFYKKMKTLLAHDISFVVMEPELWRHRCHGITMMPNKPQAPASRRREVRSAKWVSIGAVISTHGY